MNRVLITGAAGNIGTVLRSALRGQFATLRLSDIADLGEAQPGEEIVTCDLRDAKAVEAMMHDIDAVVHLGGISSEDTFDRILAGNIVGTYNVFEGSRRKGVSRIVFASSNHTIGFYKRSETIDLDAPFRSDTRYGVSKAFGEILARYYFDKFGLESASLRIGTALEKPREERHLSTWISYRDLVQLVRRCLEVQPLGCSVIYGVSSNTRSWWNNDKAGHIGYRPRDNAEDHAEEILASTPAADQNDPATHYQGGRYAAAGYTKR